MAGEKFPKRHDPLDIENYSERLRGLLGLALQSHFNIIKVLENGLGSKLANFFVDVRAFDEMNAIEAFTEFDPPRITIRQDIYEGAYRDEPRSRFTVAHELGHLSLHWGYPRPRLAPSRQKFRRSSGNQRLEDEANLFAGAFLMPMDTARKFDDPDRLAHLCGVSSKAASRRLNELWIRNGDLTAQSFQKLFGRKR